jgi:hypothetical protein
MNLTRLPPAPRLPLTFAALAVCVATLSAAPNITLWDTGSKAAANALPADHAAWKAVPSDLMALEKDPAKAASDPGYYGREYSFAGDVAIENKKFTALFNSASGRLTLLTPAAKKIAEVSLLNGSAIRKISIVRNAGDEVVLEVAFKVGGPPARYSFGKDEIIEITPPVIMDGVKIEAPLAYAIAPAFVGDDLIFGAGAEDSPDALAIPAENILLGLVDGEETTLVLTWPDGDQRAQANLGPKNGDQRPIQSLQIASDNQPIYIAVLNTPGIWHREPLKSSFLEKDVAIAWKPPFPAKWQTQLSESGITTTYSLRPGKGEIWRGVPGSYQYPVWMDGDKVTFSLSKKIPAKGEAVLYFLEGQNTPPGILTPVDILKATLGRAAAEPILDTEGRRLRTHHGSAGSNVRRACTCGYTEAIQAVFEKGEEANQKSFVDQSINDMIYFVQQHLERIDEYREFAKELAALLDAKEKSEPSLKPYLDEIRQLAQQIPQEFENQQENTKSLDYAAELSKKTMALTEEKKAGNLKEYMELLKQWRAMGGAQDFVVAQYHTLTRKLFQEASYLAATQPKAIDTAMEIRARCKQVLRSPDGYEIWANY